MSIHYIGYNNKYCASGYLRNFLDSFVKVKLSLQFPGCLAMS